MTSDFEYRFSSEVFDNETGLVYYNYRYFSPELGRWLSRDSIGERGGNNLYIICYNNLLKYFDKNGNLTLILIPDSPGMVIPKEIVDTIIITRQDGTKGRVLGKTYLDISGACWCAIKNNKCTIKCLVIAAFKITIYLPIAPGHTKGGIYGHEQRHVSAAINALNALKSEYKDITVSNRKLCIKWAKVRDELLKTDIALIKKNQGHQGDPDVLPGSPEEGKDYPPLYPYEGYDFFPANM
jgi:RHS repeat-associated protein